MMLSSRERTLAERDSDDDDLSSTSTVMSEMKEEYPLEKILAERLTENGPEWLVKWEGYPDERSTWEAKTSFTTDEPLFDWQAQKMRIDRGYEKPYDVAALEARMNGIEEARAIRKARRRAKRLRLGISVSPDESNYESSEEAEESDDEVPLERPIRSRQGSLRQRRSSLEGFVVEDDQNVRKATKSNSPQKKTEVRKRSSGYKSDDRLSDDSLFEDFKIAEFNKTHKRLKKGVKPRGEDVPSRSPVKPSKPIPQPQADRRRSMPSLQPPQYSGNANQPKSRLKGAAGTGPKRYIKKQPQTTKRKVQGAAILGNWTASVKPRKRAVVVPGATPSSGPKTFNKLSVKRRFEKASRNEPAPNPEDLVFINLKIGKVVKPSPAPLPRPSVPAQKPWEIIQQRLNKEAKEAGKTKKPSLVNPSLDDDTPMDVDTMESLAQLQQLADVPPQVKQPAMSRGRADSTQRLQTIEQSKSETVQQNLPSTGSDWVHEAVPKPSDLIVSDAPGNLPGPKRRDNDDNVSSAAPGFQRRSSNSLYSGWGHPPDPESMSSHVLATVKVGYEGREVGAVRMKGLDKASKARLLRTKEEGRVEIWFKDFCTADDYRRFFCGQDSRIFVTGYVEPFWNTAPAINAMVETLKTCASGGLYFRDDFLLLLHPVGMAEWDFLDAGMPAPPKVSSRFLMRSPLSPPHPDMLYDYNSLPPLTTMSDEPAITTVFSHLFNIDYKNLITQNSKKNNAPSNFFLMFPPSCNEEHDLTVEFLEANGAVIYSSHTTGSWDYFTSYVDTGVIIIHPSFYTYHTIPSLPTVLKKNINVFSLGTSLISSFDPSSSPPYKTIYTPTFSCERLFPHGGAILLTETLFLDDPKATKSILNWFKEYSDKKLAGTWKLVCRPRIREWVGELAEERPEDAGIYFEIFSILTSLLTQPNNTFTRSCSDDDDDDTSTLISPSSIPSLSTLSSPGQRATYLVQWFAGWASCHVTSFRRFQVVHPSVVEEWMERWKTLEVVTPTELASLYKTNEAARRKSVGS